MNRLRRGNRPLGAATALAASGCTGGSVGADCSTVGAGSAGSGPNWCGLYLSPPNLPTSLPLCCLFR